MKIDEFTSLIKSPFTYCSNGKPDSFEINHISIDSRNIPDKASFCALKGAATDGHLYCQQAIDNGALLIISEKEVAVSIPNLIVPDLKNEINRLVENIYSEALAFKGLVGVTGTNGKSTIATLIQSIYEKLNEKCGLIGTIKYSDGIDEEEASHTTPPYHTIMRILNQASRKNVKYCAIEASSHALSQNRLGNLKLKGAIFTNLTQDHLDYHDDLESYENDKRKLLNHVSENGQVVVNIDNEFGEKIYDSYKGNIVSIGRRQSANYRIVNENLSIEGSSFDLECKDHTYKVVTQMIGSYNVDNIVQVITFFVELGYPIEEILAAVQTFSGVAGRVEKVGADLTDCPVVIVDYAHTHDAMDNVLKSIAPLKENKLWIIFGCGGDRDRKKRPLMGEVSEKYGDRIIITSDNPRTEDPLSIIDEIKKGFKSDVFEVIPDREKAIEFALLNAAKNDTVVILGKGHEDYQILGSKTIDFDDRVVSRLVLEKRKNGFK